MTVPENTANIEDGTSPIADGRQQPSTSTNQNADARETAGPSARVKTLGRDDKIESAEAVGRDDKSEGAGPSTRAASPSAAKAPDYRALGRDVKSEGVDPSTRNDNASEDTGAPPDRGPKECRVRTPRGGCRPRLATGWERMMTKHPPDPRLSSFACTSRKTGPSANVRHCTSGCIAISICGCAAN